jgi:hypothetical protein
VQEQLFEQSLKYPIGDLPRGQCLLWKEERSDESQRPNVVYPLLDPKNDFVFKKLFCTPGNEDALLRFINLIFADRGLPQIADIRILNPNLDGSTLVEKSIVLDIHAMASSGELINIEMQLIYHREMEGRALYYWAKPFVDTAGGLAQSVSIARSRHRCTTERSAGNSRD